MLHCYTIYIVIELAPARKYMKLSATWN